MSLGVEALERRVLLSLPGSKPLLPGSSASPAPVAETSRIGTFDWSITNVSIEGPGPNPSVPGAMVPLSPPDVPATVVTLPEAEDFQFAGTIGPDERLQIFNVPVPPRTTSIRVEISVPETAASTTERLWLLDGSGNVVGHWPIPGPGGQVSVTVGARGPGPNTGLIVGISRDETGFDPALLSAGSYNLRIGREGGPSEAPSPSGPGLIPQNLESPFEAIVAAAPAPRPLGLGPGAAGAMPTRSSGPAAGVLADGRTVPQVGRLDGVVLDLTIIDPTATARLRGSEGEAAAPLEPLRTAGGFPLLAAARPPEPESEPHMTLDAALVVATSALAPPAEGSTAVASTSPTARPAKANEPARRRAPLGVGFGVAAALTFGLLLPDLVATFTPASPKRRLPWPRWK